MGPALVARRGEPSREGVRLRWEFVVVGKGDGVHPALHLSQYRAVECRDPAGEGGDELVELRVWNSAVDIAVPLREVTVEVLGAGEDLRGAGRCQPTRVSLPHADPQSSVP
ncbi:hypothetical protein GCM10023322_31790 [Rugosimonospora acidiphila]|uniref:Uncharacterized protein n=1 Tax=Rugosimonospora acidiphila TaxID=556531 RepID=A0ABP9RTX1_9ACTN